MAGAGGVPSRVAEFCGGSAGGRLGGRRFLAAGGDCRAKEPFPLPNRPVSGHSRRSLGDATSAVGGLRTVGCCMIASVVGGIGFESSLPVRGPLLLLGWDRD